MRRLLYGIISAVLINGCGNDLTRTTTAATSNNEIVIYANNNSTYDSTDFQQGITDINAQLSRDFYPKWNINATIIIGHGTPSVEIDNSFNDTLSKTESYATQNGAFVNYPLAQTVNNDGHEPNRCMSHEIINMLMLRTGKAINGLSITDCCGGDSYAVNGTGPQNLSDFAYPSFCIIGGQTPYDYCNILTAPLTPLPGQKLIYYAY